MIWYDFRNTGLPETSSPEAEQLINWYYSAAEELEVKTSGSTGPPKTILLQRNQILGSAKRTNNFFNISKDSIWSSALPFRGIGGIMALMRALEAGCRFLHLPPSIESLKNFKSDLICPDVLALTFAQLNALAENKHNQLRPRYILTGGGPQGSADKIGKLFPETLFYESFGMTETCSHIAIKRIFPNPEDTFQTMKGVKIRTDEQGALHISDEILGIEDLPCRDVVQLQNDHSFVWKGRLDFVINSGGIKIHPEIPENRWSSYFPVPFIYSAINDPVWGQSPALIFEDPDHRFSMKDLLSILPELPMSKEEKPRYAGWVHSFPLNEGGKPNRLQLPFCTNFLPVQW